jgi:hypothetical protein
VALGPEGFVSFKDLIDVANSDIARFTTFESVCYLCALEGHRASTDLWYGKKKRDGQREGEEGKGRRKKEIMRRKKRGTSFFSNALSQATSV